MDSLPPSHEELRELLINSPYFIWPEFSAMPLNCFDLTSALLTFPGDISKSRSKPFADCADYRFDINDLNTCPRMDTFFERERWNDDSTHIWWFLGKLQWACSPGSISNFSITQGFFSTYVYVERIQNMPGINDVREPTQLKASLERILTSRRDSGICKAGSETSIFEKVVDGRNWIIGREFNLCNFPVYNMVSAIDHRTAISIVADLDNCWFEGETIPEEVEQKHLASLWDYLSHINVHPAGSNYVEAGTIFREAPGQAEKSDDEKFEW